MLKKTLVAIGVIISFLGFILAISSVILETHIHKLKIKKNTDNQEINNILFKKALTSSFAQICIFLGFILMNSVLIYHLRDQF